MRFFIPRHIFPFPNRLFLQTVLLEKKDVYILFLQRDVRFYSSSSLHSRFDTTKPFAYYEILEIPRSAKQSDVKKAYFRMVKIYHPDVNQEENARENFDKITEAYTTLIDLTQRYFYDRHGHTSEELRKRGTPSIFDWTPKYGIYNEQTTADGESSELEDWFKAQGHMGQDKKITLRQRIKNMYVELRYGLGYYDFPWELHWFALALMGWAVGLYIFYRGLCFGIHNVENRRPIPTYLKWENDEIYDILWYSGVRKNRPSDQSKGGLYHMPKVERKKSEFSHTLYSNTRAGAKSRNLVRHKRLQEQLKKAREESWSEEQKRAAEKNTKFKQKRKKKKLNDGFSV